MSTILCIETSTKACSVALGEGSTFVAGKFIYTGEFTHAERLNPLIEDLLAENGKSFADLDAIAVSSGPGSYTGLRIGVSTAKGLCYALSIPLISIDSLSLIAKEAMRQHPGAEFYVAMMDARRMEVFSSVYSSDGTCIQPAEAKILDENSFPSLSGNTVFAGDGSDKFKPIQTHPQAVFLTGIHPMAEHMIADAFKKLSSGQIENTAYFEPFYLKEFYSPKS
ncbi:MAG: tRNA (adenosine(37)-N6)-threonylcarbamoyltransferase complex dimerization subunit type 1 TsaB [Flavobacteriales bacterium]|nr:tRNA (adenosine(37)-N6)-threonylcarbamoyltransferase complex dimerization subunit type 1 TsaB [Flavobacteriales bacterium]